MTVDTSVSSLIANIRFDNVNDMSMLADLLLDMNREDEAKIIRQAIGMTPLPNSGRHAVNKDWDEEAKEAAKSNWQDNDYLQELTTILIEEGELPIHIYELPRRMNESIDENLHEDTTWNQTFDLRESAEILDQLNNEDDEGLWQGQEPREAISTQAAYSLRNCIREHMDDILQAIRNDETVEKLTEEILDIRKRNDELGEEYETEDKEEELLKAIEQAVKDY